MITKKPETEKEKKAWRARKKKLAADLVGDAKNLMLVKKSLGMNAKRGVGCS